MKCMKIKYCIILLLVLVFSFIGCKEDEQDDTEKPYQPEVIVATHNNSYYEQCLSSYIILKGKINNGTYLSSITFYSAILKNNITNRMHEYYQVDYVNSNNKYDCYFHQFDSIDGTERVYIQNFFPYYNYDNSSKIKNINVLVKFSYDDNNNNNVIKELTYQEEVILFDNTKYSEVKSDDMCKIVNYSNIDEKVLRYKLFFAFDETKYTNGHFDVQTWIEYDDKSILPFYGLYHYQVDNGSYQTTSDEQLEKNNKPVYLYWEIRHYNSQGIQTVNYLKMLIE